MQLGSEIPSSASSTPSTGVSSAANACRWSRSPDRPTRGQPAAQVRLDHGMGLTVRAPDEALDHLRLAQRPAELVQRLQVDLDRQALRVDQHAVAIEDHQLD